MIYLLPKAFKYFDYGGIPDKVIPEAGRAHLIRYLRFYQIRFTVISSNLKKIQDEMVLNL